MYVVEVSISGIGAFTYLIAQNPYGNLIFDPRETIAPYIRNNVTQVNETALGSIHSYAGSQIGTQENVDLLLNNAGQLSCLVNIKEGWTIDGEFVVDEDSIVSSENLMLYNANLSLQYGLNYDYLDSIGYNEGVNSLIMSDRLHSTHNWVEAASVGLIANDPIYIPTYESDWGVFCIKEYSDEGAVINAHFVKVSILPSSGSPVQMTIPLPINSNYLNCGIYPANLNASTIVGIPKPQDYPDWKAIYFQVLDDTEAITSKTYIMYNAEKYGKCLGVFEKVRLAWVGRRGGWEYFNFTKESQKEIVTEKKIAQRPIGNYGVAGSSGSYGENFFFNLHDESEIVTDMKVDLYLNATSDWLTDGEFEFMKGLFMSKQVHWVHDDGTHTPVIVQADGYKIQRQFSGNKKFNQNIKVKIAQEQFN
jgi:hypothetical protein